MFVIAEGKFGENMKHVFFWQKVFIWMIDKLNKLE